MGASHAKHQSPIDLSETGFDPLKDFAPVTLMAIAAQLADGPSVAAGKNVKELVALAKARPGQLNYASGSTGKRWASRR